MWILGVTLGAILLISVLLLAVPVEVVVRLGYEETTRKIHLRWLFGLVDVGIGGGPAKPRGEGITRRGAVGTRLFAALRTEGFLGRAIEFAKEILSLVKVRTLKIDLSIGGDDHAETGLVFGALVPMVMFARSHYGLNLNLEADYESGRSVARVVGAFRAYPIRLIKPLLWFAFSPSTIKAIRAARRT